MAQMSGTDVMSFKSEGRIHDGLRSDKHENLPLKLRMKELFSSNLFSDSNEVKSDVLYKECEGLSMPHIGVGVTKEDGDCSSLELAQLLEENKSLAAAQATHALQMAQLRTELEKEHVKLSAIQLKLQEEQKLNGSFQEELKTLKAEKEKVSMEMSKIHKELNDKISEIRWLQLELSRREDENADDIVKSLRSKMATLENENHNLKMKKDELEAALKLIQKSTTHKMSPDALETSYKHSSTLNEKAHSSGSIREKEDMELSLAKLEKNLKGAWRERDKAFRQLARFKRLLLGKAPEESEEMDEDSKIIEDLRQDNEYQRTQLLHLEKALRQAIASQDEVKKINNNELQNFKEIIDDLNRKLASCMSTIDVKNAELLNLQTALGRYYTEIETKGHLKRDLALVREEAANAKLSEYLKGVFSFPSAGLSGNGKDEQFSQLQNGAGVLVEAETMTEAPYNRTSVGSDTVDTRLHISHSGQQTGLPKDSNSQEAFPNIHIPSNQITSSEIHADISGSTGADLPVVKVKKEIPDDLGDVALDQFALKERQRMLLQRKLLGVAEPVVEDNSGELSTPIMVDLKKHHAGYGKEQSNSVDGETLMAGLSYNAHQPSLLGSGCQGTATTSFIKGVHESDTMSSSEKTFIEHSSCGEQNLVPANPNIVFSSNLSTSIKAKVEPLGDSELHGTDKNALGNFLMNSMLTVKSEFKIPDESHEDDIDHMPLQDRLKLLRSGEVSNSHISQKIERSKKNVPSTSEFSADVLESVKPIRVNRQRKRKRTATDSIETALEEDAPGLLQVLIDKGILVDEIRLYGEPESNDPLDDSFSEDSFADLEAIISKIFWQSHSLLKFAPIRCKKGAKVTYCLACLISLVEQTRYLLFRKWPVEWGWCRDLQSFIFVFERHNRIVLERPEYGYATYFFELDNSLPINWQIKRLVTAMKLTTCSRVNLIENKALMVGEDLSEGEAKVLMQYGWVPNSGLGTMLNFRDRVVHDRQNDKEDISEWRSKMGKLLMDGYNGGSLVSDDIPLKVMEYNRGDQCSEIKPEPSV